MTLPQNVEINGKLIDTLSAFRRSSPRHQVHLGLEAITQIGHSRHRAKEDARALGAKTPSQIAKHTGIYSLKTRRDYQKSCEAFLKYCRDATNFEASENLRPTRNALEITPEHVRQYLATCAGRVKRSTFGSIGAALGKFATALNKFDEYNRDWTPIIQTFKSSFKKDILPARAYIRPLDILDNLAGTSLLMAELQLFTGLRISEMTKFTSENLGNGYLHLFNTKGGRYRSTINLRAETFAILKSLIEINGTFEPDLRDYQNKLREAVDNSGQPWTGSHGLRHNYAQTRMNVVQNDGLTYAEARRKISQELGHNRPEVLETYLRR